MELNRLNVVMGDITNFAGDAIVTAANSFLMGGGGVDGAIHNAAGPELLEACKKLGGCQEGHSKITPGFDLKAKHVIHTVGPYWFGGKNNEPEALASCYQTSLAIALAHNIETIAFPAISCGIYSFPIEEATQIAINTTVDFIELNPLPNQITFICFEDEIHKSYVEMMNTLKCPVQGSNLRPAD